MTHSGTEWFCPLSSCRLSQMGGGTHRSLMKTSGLNCSLGTAPGAVRGHGCSPDSWDQTQAWEACCLPGSLSEGSDSCFVSQEKLKPGYLKEIPGRMKLFSVFLGKRCWFAGNKVRGMAFGEGELSFFPRLRVWCTFLRCLPAAHLCGFPGL